MRLDRAFVLDALFCVCLAAIAASGAVEELRRPQPVCVPVAAMACVAASFVPVRGGAWRTELLALGFVFCALPAGGLAVAMRGLPGVGDAAVRPGAIPVLALGAAALAIRPRLETGLWTVVLVASAAAVAACLCIGFLPIKHYHDVEVSAIRGAVFNMALGVAAYLTGAALAKGSGKERLGPMLVGSTAVLLLAAGLAGRYLRW